MSTQSLPSRAAVVIIGGGMAGLSCASSLAQQGVNDVVCLMANTLALAGACREAGTARGADVVARGEAQALPGREQAAGAGGRVHGPLRQVAGRR